jgi:hypothetical protein
MLFGAISLVVSKIWLYLSAPSRKDDDDKEDAIFTRRGESIGLIIPRRGFGIRAQSAPLRPPLVPPSVRLLCTFSAANKASPSPAAAVTFCPRAAAAAVGHVAILKRPRVFPASVANADGRRRFGAPTDCARAQAEGARRNAAQRGSPSVRVRKSGGKDVPAQGMPRQWHESGSKRHR